MAPADRVDPTARPQGERRHARRLVGVCRVDAPGGEELLAVAGQVGDAPERRQHLVARVGFVAGRHRGVGREHHLLAHPLPGGVQTGSCHFPRLGQQLEHAERGVPLVDVIDGRIDAERTQRPYPADAEHGVLRQPDRAIAFIKS